MVATYVASGCLAGVGCEQLRNPNTSSVIWRSVVNERFRQVVESLQPKLDQLLKMAPLHATTFPAGVPLSGIYLFSEGNKHLYVGRSGSMPTRLRNHWS